MGKHEFLTPKAIGNRIKAKGLQKLRWYCQMCQKQCRDENGFKCHCESESHQRQILIFADNPTQFLDQYSKVFEEGFMEILKRRHGTKRVKATTVYNEYIQDRHHIHMNSTVWETLTIFIQYLGKEGHCIVDETPKGWFVSYVDRDPQAIARQESLKKKERRAIDDETRSRHLFDNMIKEAQLKQQTKNETCETPSEISLQNNGAESNSVSFNISTSILNSHKQPTKLPEKILVKKKPHQTLSSVPSTAIPSSSRKRQLSAIEEIKLIEESKKAKTNSLDNWLHLGIVVKVLTKKLANGKYYKKKGQIMEVVDKYIGVVRMIDSGDLLRIDQSELETVIPTNGKKVLVVNGQYRGKTAIVESIDVKNYCAYIKIVETSGSKIPIEYEKICKIA